MFDGTIKIFHQSTGDDPLGLNVFLSAAVRWNLDSPFLGGRRFLSLEDEAADRENGRTRETSGRLSETI